MSQLDELKFPLQNPVEINDLTDSLANQELDSVHRMKWTDKIMPESLAASRLYSVRYLALYKKVGKFNVVVVNTRADDWGKSFLLTVDDNSGLVDYAMIAESFGDGTDDEKGNSTVTNNQTWARYINDSTFERITIREKTTSYDKSAIITKRDSIVEELSINSNGKFIAARKDSARKFLERKLD